MKKSGKTRRLLTLVIITSMVLSLFSFTAVQAADKEAGEIPIKVVFNVNYIDGLDPAKNGEFDPSKAVEATLDMKKGYQTISFNLADVKEQLGEDISAIESFGIIPGGEVYFDENEWEIVGGWPKDVDTLWVDDISIGDVAIFKDDEVREFIFKNFTIPMNEDWDELYDSPRYPYASYGINSVISDTEGVNDSSCIKHSIRGAVGASWIVLREPVDISGMADTDTLAMSIDAGKNEYPKWTPEPVSTKKPITPAPTYEIGPGKEFENISDVAWEDLKAGDVVYIYWREAPYNEKFVISAQGTEEKPVIIHGVPGPEGQLPKIDGNNATTRATMAFSNQKRGLIKIGQGTTPARFVTIENLEIYNAHPTKKYINPGNGQPAAYGNNASGIWVENGENITIRNCTVRDCGNGLFVTSYSDIDYWGEESPFDSFINFASRDILIEGNYFYNNGVRGRMFEHNTYSAAINTTYQFNRYGPLVNGSRGYGLKDRGSGTVIRYNWIEGGRRQISLDDAEDTALITFDPRYNDSFVYGNVLVEPDHKFDSWGDDEILHFGGDTLTVPYRHGTLYFYNNTIVTYRMIKEYGEGSFNRGRQERTVLFYLPTNDQHVEAKNNIFYKGGDAPIVILNGSGSVDLSHNWFSEGWGYDFNPDTSSAIINDDGTNIDGENPGFVNGDVKLPEGMEMDPENTLKLMVKYGSDELAVYNEGISRAGIKQDIVMNMPVTAVKGRTYMPAQTLVEYLGGVYYWNAGDSRIDIVLGLKKISLWIGKSEAEIDGEKVQIDSEEDVVPMISDTGEIIVPLRFTAEVMEAEVIWDQDTKSISISRDVGKQYKLTEDSPCIKAGVNPNGNILSEDNFFHQYIKHQDIEERGKNTFKDLGANSYEK